MEHKTGLEDYYVIRGQKKMRFAYTTGSCAAAACKGACLMLLGKEMKIGLLNGGLLGILALVLLGVYVHAFKGYAWAGAFAVSGCVGISLVLAMMVSSMVGTVIPMFFHKIKVDPAVASGPLITTVNDLVAVVTYYGLAFLFLVK